MFRQISNSSDPKIIGVKNGIYQVEITDEYLESRQDYSLLESYFLSPRVNDIYQYNKDIFSLEIPTFEGEFLKKAKLTDLMGFSPYFFGCKYLVSSDFVNCLSEHNVSLNEYQLFSISLTDVEKIYYIMFVPFIPHNEINFQDSLIFPEREYLKSLKSYYKVNTYSDYKDLIRRTTMSSFEKVVIPKKYCDYDILSIQGISNLFFSTSLIEKIVNNDISSFIHSGRQVTLDFTASTTSQAG